ncbi:MAG: hypothetical protein CM15mV90_190 [uncultured marine virus]|nr:MAG: hypothetical protein CM15mV90_190 [uncultured marine virus]
MRFKASAEAGLLKVPVIRANELTEAQQRESLQRTILALGIGIGIF